jgi:hypothetical protein
MVFHFADGQRITRQEEDRNCNGKPDRLTIFDPDGQATMRCTPYEVISFAGGEPAQAVEDSTRDGYGDRRQVFDAGVQTRMDADTNADRIPDVWITYANGAATEQLEDSNFDGKIDAVFDLATEEATPVNGTAPPSLEKFKRVRCKDFSDFWRK